MVCWIASSVPPQIHAPAASAGYPGCPTAAGAMAGLAVVGERDPPRGGRRRHELRVLADFGE